ncbi:15251_t:CDS:2, partial [Cetraspora pellucida]
FDSLIPIITAQQNIQAALNIMIATPKKLTSNLTFLYQLKREVADLYTNTNSDIKRDLLITE